MGGGPDAAVKLASAHKDSADTIDDSWSDLGRQFLYVVVVAFLTWAFVCIIRLSVEELLGFVFSPFEVLAEASGEASAAAEGADAEISTFRLENAPWILLGFLVGGALLRAALLQLPSWKSSEGDGMGASLVHFHDTYDHDATGHQPRYDLPDFAEAGRRVVLTILTVGSGGSAGTEAPVVPIGENIGAGVSRLFGVDRPENLRIYQMAGMAAAVSTLLDAPMTAGLFAAEVVYHGAVLYRTLMYSLIAAIVAFVCNNHIMGMEPLFNPEAHTASYSPVEYLEVAAVALLISAPAGFGVGWLFQRLKALIEPFPAPARPIIGAVATGAIGLAFWFGLGIEPRHVLGVGEETIIEVMEGKGNPLLGVWWVLLLLAVGKAFTTGFTLMAGGSGGALVPAMFMGGVSGAAVHHLLAQFGVGSVDEPALFVVAGVCSALVAVVQVPLAAIAFSMEAFGAAYGPPAIVSCVVTYQFAKKWRLYLDDGHDDHHHEDDHHGH